MIATEVKVVNLKDIERKLGNLKSKAPTVAARAINRAITTAKSSMGKETSAKYHVTSGTVKGTISLSKANAGSLKAKAESKDARVKLFKFKVSPKTQVRVTSRGGRSPRMYKAAVKKDGGYKPLSGNPKPFVTGMRSGHMGVFERTSGSRLPIKELYGPAVPQMIKNEEVMSKIQEKTNETLKKRIDHEISNLLSKG